MMTLNYSLRKNVNLFSSLPVFKELLDPYYITKKIFDHVVCTLYGFSEVNLHLIIHSEAVLISLRSSISIERQSMYTHT